MSFIDLKLPHSEHSPTVQNMTGMSAWDGLRVADDRDQHELALHAVRLLLIAVVLTRWRERT